MTSLFDSLSLPGLDPASPGTMSRLPSTAPQWDDDGAGAGDPGEAALPSEPDWLAGLPHESEAPRAGYFLGSRLSSRVTSVMRRWLSAAS